MEQSEGSGAPRALARPAPRHVNLLLFKLPRKNVPDAPSSSSFAGHHLRRSGRMLRGHRARRADPAASHTAQGSRVRVSARYSHTTDLLPNVFISFPLVLTFRPTNPTRRWTTQKVFHLLNFVCASFRAGVFPVWREVDALPNAAARAALAMEILVRRRRLCAFLELTPLPNRFNIIDSQPSRHPVQ